MPIPGANVILNLFRASLRNQASEQACQFLSIGY